MRDTAGRTARFELKKAAILNVASAEINLHGTRGLTLTAVARAIGVDTSTVTYYFRFKDELAAACLQRSLERLHDLALHAAAGSDSNERIGLFVAGMISIYREQRDPNAVRLANLADLSALEDSVRAPLDAAYGRTFALVRSFFEAHGQDHALSRTAVAANILLETCLWMTVWIDDYQDSDLARVTARFSDVLRNGIGQGGVWPITADDVAVAGGAQDPQTRFLHAATNLINRIGYRGASVERISAGLDVSIGSFYHHLDHKDELVIACFDRSFGILEKELVRSHGNAGSPVVRLGSLLNILLRFQFSAESPLLRAAAYQTLPSVLRERMLHRSRGATLQIAGLIADGIADGSLRGVDPLIAAHTVMAAVHAAVLMRVWASRRPLEEAVRLYGDALRVGLGLAHG